MYSRLKLSHAGDSEHAIHLDKEIGLGGDTVLVRKSGAPLSEPVPGLYTRAVFSQVAGTGKYEIASEFVGDSWVLGEGVASKTDIPRLASDMMRLYEDDYIRVWGRLDWRSRCAADDEQPGSVHRHGAAREPDLAVEAAAGPG